MVFLDLTYQQEPRLRRQKRSLNFWKRILRPYLTQNCISQSRSNSLSRKLLDVSLWADIKKISAILRRGCDDEKGDSASGAFLRDTGICWSGLVFVVSAQDSRRDGI